MSLLMLEGPNGAGKSTLIRKLAKTKPNWTLMPTARKPESNPNLVLDDEPSLGNVQTLLFEYQLVETVNANPDWTFMLDRSFISSIAYGKLKGTLNYISEELYMQALVELHRAMPIGIIAVPGLQEYCENGFEGSVKLSGLEYTRLCQIYDQLFDKIANCSAMPTVLYHFPMGAHFNVADVIADVEHNKL